MAAHIITREQAKADADAFLATHPTAEHIRLMRLKGLQINGENPTWLDVYKSRDVAIYPGTTAVLIKVSSYRVARLLSSSVVSIP